MTFVGTHPSGRRYYAKPQTTTALAFAVFVRRRSGHGSKHELKWHRIALIEERPYPDELHRVNGSYVPLGRDMTPREMADQRAFWYRDVLNYEATVVELRPAGGAQ